MAELVDALDSKSSDSNVVRVRFPPPVPFRGQIDGLIPNHEGFFQEYPAFLPAPEGDYFLSRGGEK